MSLTTPSLPGDPCVAFVGHRRVARGTLAEVAEVLDRCPPSGEPVIVLDEASCALLDVPQRRAVAADPAPAAAPPAPAGRPRLGVVAREVTLLPRHWQWLAVQPSGASAALRRLVEEARRTHAERDRRRAATERAFRFLQAVGGDLAGFEQAARLLFAADGAAFAAQVAAWPPDVRGFVLELAADAFEPATSVPATAPRPAAAGTVHLVVGPLGAGKSTYAAALARRVDGVVLSIDAWMDDLYGADIGAETDFDWVMARVRRCEARLWATALALAHRGVAAVLDVGGLTVADRARFVAWAEQTPLALRRHLVDAPQALRRERVAQRNRQRGPTHVFAISPALFDRMDGLYEPPTAAERVGLEVVDTADGRDAAAA